ncbi:hypothetical protein CEXT_190821 [Caerostris extrusa]|uniref:Uncharacterized protein n=1 Tax=Caerostris extrusa TaxID=172846 RepID=A0AAV4VUQ8_CAEEX|nr:hypothetical protein CEXT_190821 [Caerostris extrusa]
MSEDGMIVCMDQRKTKLGNQFEILRSGARSSAPTVSLAPVTEHCLFLSRPLHKPHHVNPRRYRSLMECNSIPVTAIDELCVDSPIPYLIIIAVLMSTASANPMPADDIMRVKELSFAEKLQNPCALADATRLQRESLSAEERLSMRKTMIKELKAKVILLNESAATILRTNVIHDCSSLKLPLVAIVPIAEDLLNRDPVDVFRMYYTSVLNHTAHVYFIPEQHEKYADEACSSDGLPLSAKTLGSNMRELLCILRLCIMSMKSQDDDDDSNSYFTDSISQILNELLMDQPFVLQEICQRLSDCLQHSDFDDRNGNVLTKQSHH